MSPCYFYGLTLSYRKQHKIGKGDENEKVETLTLRMCHTLGLLSPMCYDTRSSSLLTLEIRKQELSWPQSQSK